MGNTDAAIESLRRVEPAGPNMPMIYYLLGRAYRSKGDPARATGYMERFQQATSAERDRQARALEVERPIAQAQRQLDQGKSRGSQGSV